MGLLVLAATTFAIACGDDDDAPAKSIGATTTEAAAATKTTIEAADFKFTPTGFDAQSGKAVTVTIKNVGKAQHTFTVDEFNVDKTVDAGQSVDVTFTPDRDGDFTFYCRFHGQSNGMKGTVSVTGGAGGAAATTTAASPATTKASSGYYGY
jgi:plastocyanin